MLERFNKAIDILLTGEIAGHPYEPIEDPDSR